LVLAFNHLTQNMFFSGSPYSIDTDDGCNQINATANVLVQTPLFKTDFGGHSKHYSKNVVLFGSEHGGWAQGGCSCAMDDGTNVFTMNKCVGVLSLFNCGNNTDVCPSSHTPHFTPPGNATTCATVAGNQVSGLQVQ
jgi:hypothetical protein